jgi:hypothetical protein
MTRLEEGTLGYQAAVAISVSTMGFCLAAVAAVAATLAQRSLVATEAKGLMAAVAAVVVVPMEQCRGLAATVAMAVMA